MSEQQDPPRLFSSGGTGDELKLALATAREDVPSAARLEAILASLPRDPGPPDGGGNDGGGDPGPATGGADVTSMAPAAAAAASGWGKLGGILALGAALGGVGYVATRGDAPVPPPANRITEPSSTSSTDTAAPEVVPTTAPSAAELAPSATPTTRVQAPRPTASVEAPEARPEIEILREAQQALGSNPARALALADEHARSHPKGQLGQEREMLRIQALVALGRKDEARALAKAFKERHPKSGYLPRLDAMFP
jgi:hypothetical protein